MTSCLVPLPGPRFPRCRTGKLRFLRGNLHFETHGELLSLASCFLSSLPLVASPVTSPLMSPLVVSQIGLCGGEDQDSFHCRAPGLILQCQAWGQQRWKPSLPGASSPATFLHLRQCGGLPVNTPLANGGQACSVSFGLAWESNTRLRWLQTCRGGSSFHLWGE